MDFVVLLPMLQQDVPEGKLPTLIFAHKRFVWVGKFQYGCCHEHPVYGFESFGACLSPIKQGAYLFQNLEWLGGQQ